jgi:hypothetical protein
MKLRIKGNSLRFRVSRSELGRLLSGEAVQETVRFGSEPEARLTYILSSVEQGPAVEVHYSAQIIAVILSRQQALDWSSEKEVGVYTTLDVGAAETLEVVIEKDFACLDRSDADNVDTFANPLAGATC